MKFQYAITAALLLMPAFAGDGTVVAGQGKQVGVQPIPFPPPPMIESVSPFCAMAQPAEVTLTGSGLDFVREVLIGGQAAAILQSGPSQLIVLPQPLIPGFHDVVANSVAGMASGARLEVWPSIEVSVVESSLDIRLGNGDDGVYILAAHLETRAEPLIMTNPPTGYMLLLDDDFFVLSIGVVPSADPMLFGFEIPPVLHGLPLNVQAWCQQHFAPGKMTRCFSNMASTRM